MTKVLVALLTVGVLWAGMVTSAAALGTQGSTQGSTQPGPGGV